MKIAIAKIGANITLSKNNGSAANADILYALRTMKGFGHRFTIVTHKTSNTSLPVALGFEELYTIKDFNDYDCVMLFNGSINFFGGVEDPGVISLYKALAKTRKPVFFVNTDGVLVLRNLWPMIANREWAKGYSEKDFDLENTPIHYLTQGRDLPKMRRHIIETKNSVIPLTIDHFPWEQTILSEHEKWFPIKPRPVSKREYDLGFGGYIRNSHKQRRIERYYDEADIRTLLFGNLRGINLKNTELHPKISFQSMVPTMEQCQASVIVGDLLYNDNFHTLRMYECLLAGCAVLIDKQLDSKGEFYKDISPGNRFYVNSPSDVRAFIWNDSIDDLVMDMRYKVLRNRANQMIDNVLLDRMVKICGQQ
jgi:hypothetical protein